MGRRSVWIPLPGDLGTAAVRDYQRYRAFPKHHREQGRISRNPLLEIVQVAQTALDQRDNYGALQAVSALQDGTIRIVEDYNTSGSSGRDPLHKLFDYWNQVTRTAVERGADDVLHHIVEAQTAIAERAIVSNLPEICDSATDSLELLCERAIHADRIEHDYLEGLGDVLVTAVAEDDMVATNTTVDHLEGFCETVEIAPNADPAVLSVVAVQLLRGQHRLVESYPTSIHEEHHARAYAHLESAADRCVGDLLVTSVGVNDVGEAFRDVAVAAAEADHQWIVRRIATRIIDLNAAAGERYPDADDHVEAIHHAGGEDGVENAFDYVRGVYDDGPVDSFDDPVSRLES